MPKQKTDDAEGYEESESLGNATPRPRAGRSENPIVERLNEAELTTRDSPYYRDSYDKPYNSDDIVKKRTDYATYDRDMPNDDQISVCLELKKDLVLGSGFEFVCDEGDETTEEIQRDLEVAFCEDPDRDIEESFYEMLTAYEIGFSLTEKVWKKRDDGKITIKSLKTRHPSTWLIHTDAHGNVEKYEQRTPTGPVDIDPKNLIHLVNNPRYQNPYGRSDLRAAYDAWFIKREIVKYYAIYLEKAASPMPVAKYDKNVPPEAVADIHNAIKSFQAKTSLTIPKAIEVDFLEASNNGDAYVKGINIFNMFIGRSLFIPDLLGFQGSETSGGSYSLGKDQMMILYKHIERRRAAFEKLINMHLVRPFVFYNYGFIEKYPKFRLKEISDEKAIECAKLWLEVIKGKVWEPTDEEIAYMRRLLKFPAGEIERPEPPPPPMLPGMPGQPPQPGKPPEEEPEPEPEEAPTEEAPTEEAPEQEPEENEADDAEKKKFAKAFDATAGDYHKKVNFKLLKSTLDQGLARVKDEGDALIREIYDDLFEQIRKKKILQSQDLAKIEKIRIKKLPQLRALLKRRFGEVYKDSAKQARGEIVKGAQNYAAPLPNEDFMDFLDEETFQFIGDWEYNVKKKTRIALAAAIKDGKPLSDVTDVLDDEGVKLSSDSLERYARTKFTEVMNRGRMEAFDETGVVAAYQFTAIMDDRVSDICGGLHGAIFEKDNAPVPPLHFNCRSALIPITKYEDYKVTKSVEGMNIDKFIDANIGDGFSKK